MDTINFVSPVDSNAVPISTTTPSKDRDQLILENLEYVRQICGTLAVRLPDTVDLENLQSAGVVGLIEAANNFDRDRGVAFKTFAYPRIRGAIVDEIRRNSPLSQRALKLISTVRTAMDSIEPPIMPEALAEKTGLKIEEIEEAIEAMRLCTTHRLDHPFEVSELITSKSVPCPLEMEEMKRAMADGIEKLPDRERVVLTMYYLEELRLKEIGAVLGLSESRVSRILSKAEFRLQQYCQSV